MALPPHPSVEIMIIIKQSPGADNSGAIYMHADEELELYTLESKTVTVGRDHKSMETWIQECFIANY